MQAEILVGVEISLPVKDADFEPIVKNNAAIALGEFRDF